MSFDFSFHCSDVNILWHSFSPSRSTEVGGVVTKIGFKPAQAQDEDIEIKLVKVGVILG